MSPTVRSTAPKHWTLSGLLAQAGIRTEEPLPHLVIQAIADDSRCVAPGSCFVAVRGDKIDGHRFIGDAIAKGAVAVVTEDRAAVPPTCVALPVCDSREALARLAAAYYGLRSDSAGAGALRLLGITGTNGKTTVAWMLRSILRAAGEPTALFGTIEYDLITECVKAPLTTPGALDLARHLAVAADAGATHAVLEVSSHALDQRRTDGLRFAAGVFTNLTGDHLDYHGTMEAYLAAKRRLFTGLPPEAIAVVNADDPAGHAVAEGCAAPTITYGIRSQEADATAEIRRLDLCGSEFVIRAAKLEGGRSPLPVRLSLGGTHNVLNALAAAVTARAIGIHDDAIQQGLGAVRGVPGRLERVEPVGFPFNVLVDYAHSDDALANVLHAVRPLTRGRVICVFGCGGERDVTKRPRMAEVVQRFADVAVVTSDNPRREDPDKIVQEILRGFRRPSAESLVVQVDRRRAIMGAIKMAQPGDTVLIAGKGHEDYQDIGGGRIPFSDVEVARAALGVARARMGDHLVTTEGVR